MPKQCVSRMELELVTLETDTASKRSSKLKGVGLPVTSQKAAITVPQVYLGCGQIVRHKPEK